MSLSSEKILLLLLGWLLGLLSPIIVDAVRSRREAKRGRIAILAELREISKVLAFATYRAKVAAGTLDRDFLQWMQERIAVDDGHTAKKFLELIPPLLALPDEQIFLAASHMATAEAKATMLQQYPAPLLDVRVSALWTFDTKLQGQLLVIHRNLSLLDNIILQARDFFRLTFNALAQENHQLVQGNLKQCYGNYAERSKIIVDQISGLYSAGVK